MLQEWQYAKVRQDAQLERIEKGVSTLGDMAKGMQVGKVHLLQPVVNTAHGTAGTRGMQETLCICMIS